MVGGPNIDAFEKDENVVGFEVGFNAEEVSQDGDVVEDYEVLRAFSPGSVVRDKRNRILFRTQANGWATTASTHVSTIYVALPAIVIHREGLDTVTHKV